MSAPKYKIWRLPQGSWRISINMGVDALDGGILWGKGAEVDFASRLAAEEAMMRIVIKEQSFYDDEGNTIRG